MNPIPIALTAAVVAVVPPLRRRVAPVAAASATAVVAVAVTAVEGAIGVGRAVLDGASAPDPAA